MADFPTFQDLFRIGRDEVLGRNARIQRAVIEREGTDSNALVGAGTAVGDENIGQLTRIEASVFLDSAKGLQLDRLLFDRYNLTRKPATPSFGEVQFTTSAPTLIAFAIPANTRLKTSDNKTFLTIGSATFPAVSTGPINVQVRSADAGLNQQAAIGTIANIIDIIPSAPADLRVNNATATAGADNAEQDDAFRERGRRFFVTARRGTRQAIEFAALEVPGVRTATAFEALDELGRPARADQLIISDAFTEALIAVNPTPTAYQVQSQVLAQQVFLALDEWRALGINVNVTLASVTLLGVQLGLTFQAGVDTDSVAASARSFIVDYVNNLAPGQPFVPSQALQRLRLVPGLIVTGGEILSPQGVVTPQVLEVLRSTLGLVVASNIF